jgi:hypothetical protein
VNHTPVANERRRRFAARIYERPNLDLRGMKKPAPERTPAFSINSTLDARAAANPSVKTARL